jgi:hypothetical protein
MTAWTDHILPRDLYERARSETRAAFAKPYRDTQLLLVRLDALDSELALGLGDASTAAGVAVKPADGLGFRTIVGKADMLRTALPSQRPAFNAARVKLTLIKQGCFVVPLRKRELSGKTFSERISVGRARNNDVVLRDKSVSKFHAWFEVNEDGRFFLGDARSTNTTKLNGVVLGGQDLADVYPGDEITFGTVETSLCDATTLWEALTSG